MANIAYINNEYQDFQTAKIPALDRGLLFGDSCFEVFVCFGEKVLNTEEHLNRLFYSFKILGYSCPWTKEELKAELLDIAKKLAAPKGYIRLIVSRGSGLGLLPDEKLTPNKYIFALPAKIEKPELYKKGLSLKSKLKPYTIRNAHAKTGNYLDSIIGLKEAQAIGFSELLWVNADHEITESSTANIFFIRKEKDGFSLHTPSSESGILLGITRQTLLSILKHEFEIKERIISADEIFNFSEAFICSTVRGLIPINRIDQKEFVDHTVFSHIQALYMKWVCNQVGFELDWNTGLKKILWNCPTN